MGLEGPNMSIALATFKKRFFGLNLGMSKTPLRDFLRKLGAEPYRDFVEYRIKDLSAKELQDAAINGISLRVRELGVSVDLEAMARLSAILRSRILIDADYWSGPSARNCTEALVDILSIIDDETDIPARWDKTVETLTEQQQSFF